MSNTRHPCNHCALCEVALFPPLLFLAICRQWLTPHFSKSFLPRSVGGLHNSCCLLTNTKAQAIYYYPVVPWYEPTNINESFNLVHIFQPITSKLWNADQLKLGSVAGPVIQANGRLKFEDDLRSGGLLYFCTEQLSVCTELANSVAKLLCNQVRSLDHFVVQNFGDFLC